MAMTSQSILADWQEAMNAYFQRPKPLFSKELVSFIQLVILDNAVQTTAHPFKLTVDWDRLPANDDRWWGMFWTVMKDLLYAGQVPFDYEKTCRKMRQQLDGRWHHFRERFAAVHLGWMEKNIEELGGRLARLEETARLTRADAAGAVSRVSILEQPFWRRRRIRKMMARHEAGIKGEGDGAAS